MTMDDSAQCIRQIIRLSFGSLLGSQLRPRSILITGVHGIGKTYLVEHIADAEGLSCLRHVYDATVSEGNLEGLLSRARMMQPCILFFDGLDLFPSLLIEQIAALTDQLSPSEAILLVCSAVTPEHIPLAVRDHLEYQFGLDLTTSAQRLAVLRSCVASLTPVVAIDDLGPGVLQWFPTAASLMGLARHLVRSLGAAPTEAKSTVWVAETQVSQAAHEYQASVAAVAASSAGSAVQPVALVSPGGAAGAGALRTVGGLLQPDMEAFGALVGLEEPLKRLAESALVPLLNWERLRDMGITPVRGALLVGPSGSGKTAVAQACAAACRCSALTVAMSDLIRAGVGDTEKAIRDVFSRARAQAPCVIVLDEVHALASADSTSEMSANVRADITRALPDGRIVAQLLAEFDGVTSDAPVLVAGTAPTPQSVHKALVQPGRFEAVVTLTLPTSVAHRLAILRQSLTPVRTDPTLVTATPGSVDPFLVALASMTLDTTKATWEQVMGAIAVQAYGWSAPDLQRIVRDAGLLALAAQRVAVTPTDLHTAYTRQKQMRRWTTLIEFFRKACQAQRFELQFPHMDFASELQQLEGSLEALKGALPSLYPDTVTPGKPRPDITSHEEALSEVMRAYAIASLYYAHLKATGQETAKNPIQDSMQRIRNSFKQVRLFRQPEGSTSPSSPLPDLEPALFSDAPSRIDVAVARRMLSHAGIAGIAGRRRR
ncbi:putative cell division cycle protein 48 [Paratrimastix pyriformis]|uniref:Cell division cycle protein 48 n=1 Tax=Paratrimastix pyriformis TaxID=342808 RepID=A0ABQ8UAX1_9EUKA|nr:putative cell division cycle protein 48 [Paratrimastix pyriformis]